MKIRLVRVERGFLKLEVFENGKWEHLPFEKIEIINEEQAIKEKNDNKTGY